MISWMRENVARKPGLNIYHPDQWSHSIGFEFRTKKHVYAFRYSRKLKKLLMRHQCHT